MKKTILKWIILTALLAYAASVTIWAGHEASRHLCRNVEIVVDGAGSAISDSITKEGVIAELQRYGVKLQGAPINTIDTRRLEKHLSRLKNLEDVHCCMTADRRLEIHVRPMIPEMRVFAGSKSWYVNKDGKAVESTPDFFSDVPVVSGDFKKGFQPKDVLPLSRFIRNNNEMSQLITMIVARDKDNLMLVPRFSGHIINFGDTTRMAEKAKYLLAFYRKVLPYKGWNCYDTISVKYKNQIIATRRDKTVNTHGAIADEDYDPEEATLQESIPAAAQQSQNTDSISHQ